VSTLCHHNTPAAVQVGGNRRLTAHVERRERLAGGGKSWGAQVRAWVVARGGKWSLGQRTANGGAALFLLEKQRQPAQLGSHCLTCPPILPLPPSPSTAQAPTKLHLTLIESGSDDLKQSVNGQLLAAGLARLVEPKGPQVGWF